MDQPPDAMPATCSNLPGLTKPPGTGGKAAKAGMAAAPSMRNL